MGRGDHYAELTREELYAQVWAEPMTKLAQRYGLSDRGLAKICTRTAYGANIRMSRMILLSINITDNLFAQ